MALFATGLRWSDWRRLLRENAPAVDKGYRMQAGLISLGTALTSLVARCEPEVSWSDELEQLWRQPVIILGLPRSGTTFLHQLLAGNPRFSHPTRLDCFNPWTCLALHRWGIARLLSRWPQRARGMDRVQINWQSPEEDDFAISILTAAGPWINHLFPRSYAERCRAIPFDYTDSETPVWPNALRLFTRKLVWRTGRPLVLKSPQHTGRVPQLLELFPQARFITIFRDPREQLRSAIDVPRKAKNWGALQISTELERSARTPERMTSHLQILLQRYFDTRDQIPQGQLAELTYEELVGNPLPKLRDLHQRLDLPGVDELQDRLATNPWWREYQCNPPRPLTPDERQLALTTYLRLFRAGYYPEVLRELQTP